jgi:LPXTG-motif cell wall-anchored protein
MNYKQIGITVAVVGLMALLSPVKAMAVPHFTLTPSSGNETMGQDFSVVMGVDSDTEKVVGIDIKASFDSSKLEVVSIEKGVVPDTGYQFSYTSGQAIIHNDTGIFEVTLTPLNQSVLVGPVAKHELLKITFRPKATGTATLNFTCLPGSVVETNIISQTGTDVVDCTANQSGSYVIGSGTGGSTDTTTVATATPIPATTTSLPQTGMVENTVMLVVFGIISVVFGVYFGLL